VRGSIKIDGLLENDMGMEIVETTIPSGKVVVSRCVCVCVCVFDCFLYLILLSGGRHEGFIVILPETFH